MVKCLNIRVGCITKIYDLYNLRSVFLIMFCDLYISGQLLRKPRSVTD